MSKFQKLEEDYLSLLAEFNTLKCKLECKTDSLLILSQELEKCRSERDQYKLMADQIRDRYNALKRRIEGWGPSLMEVYDVDGLKCEKQKSLAQLLCELKEQNKILRYKNEDLRQRLDDTQGDVKILREEITKLSSDSGNEFWSSEFVPFSEKEALVTQLEIQKLKCLQLTQDLESVFDEKEELVTARDQYRHKFERLNQQMNYVLRGDQKRPIDIDGVLMENRYLIERIKQVEEEKTVTSAALEKCKLLLEKKRVKGGMRNSIMAGLTITAKQVETLLQNNPFLDVSSKSSNAAEIRNVIITLLENLNDKSVALLHQRKANKILGSRISELEDRIKSIEVTSFCHNSDSNQYSLLLHSLKSIEMPPDGKETVGMTLPCPEKALEGEGDISGNPPDDQSLKSDDQFSPSEISLDMRTHSGFSDLDILPTKEFTSSGLAFERQESVSSCSHYSDSKLSYDSLSPSRDPKNVHSDSDLSPMKATKKTPSYSVNSDRRDWTSLDVEDLPLKLQKFVENAFSEIEKNSESDTVVKSPLRKARNESVKIDPDC
ncbi:coiled-coil domain-containing protein 149 [Parasteatoda tepidariorum]|uniref:coiled-coil domain-containing protein 149 n=1 Tax=Parasteatoda tepidariorum TaxID=114398 RepID=UPI00077FD8CA|nr:coiled-coil domain-containing protein 149 isoform X2 [Parasteatoda tepidariorum]